MAKIADESWDPTRNPEPGRPMPPNFPGMPPMIPGQVNSGAGGNSTAASTTTEATSEAAASTSGSKTDVAFVTDVGNIDDQSFNQYTWQGVQDFCSANSLNANYYRPTEDSDAARLEQIDIFTGVKRMAFTLTCSSWLWTFPPATWATRLPPPTPL